MAAGGPGQFYQPGYLADYPPGYMYVLWGLGAIAELVRPFTTVLITPGLVKLPAILADGGVAWLLFLYARRWGSGWLGSWSGARAVYVWTQSSGPPPRRAAWPRAHRMDGR